ncbi:MAG: helix-turn-helix domain-containing protein [Defluviitaleaceae bacterium]|nr:helix-turn-helix domain-containing protein [Defluviitaleaceae bacterium]
MENEVYDFGKRLKKLREESNLTQAEVARSLGVQILTVKRYESNEQQPPIDKLQAMSLMYKTSLDYLRNLEKRKPLFICDLPQSKQVMVLEIINCVRKEDNFSKNNNISDI